MPRVKLAPNYDISRVIKGEWQLSQGHLTKESIDRNIAIEDTIAFVEKGITTLDFGDIYLGVEELIGESLNRYTQKHGQDARDTIQLHTKYVPDVSDLASHSMENVRRVTNRSRQRLGVDVLDLVQFHWWDYETPGYVDAMLSLQQLQSEGSIKNIGITNFDIPRMQEFIDAGVTPISVQVQYSALDHRPANNMVNFCKKHDIKMLCYGTVAGGFLSDKYLGMQEPQPPYKNRSLTKYKLIIDEFGGWELFQELLSSLKIVADRHDASIATIASAYVLHQPQVASVIVGAHDRTHLEDNLHIGTIKLSNADILLIDAVTQKATGPMGDVYELERDDPHHANIMHKTNNSRR